MYMEKSSSQHQLYISKVEMMTILSSLNVWLNSIHSYRRDPAELCDVPNEHDMNFRIVAKRAAFDIYIRFGQTWIKPYCKTIVIARIGFHKERVGYGTELLKKLTVFAVHFKYQFIAIECVNSNSSAFARHFGFIPYENDKNYIIATEKLRTIFNI